MRTKMDFHFPDQDTILDNLPQDDVLSEKGVYTDIVQQLSGKTVSMLELYNRVYSCLCTAFPTEESRNTQESNISALGHIRDTLCRSLIRCSQSWSEPHEPTLTSDDERVNKFLHQRLLLTDAEWATYIEKNKQQASQENKLIVKHDELGWFWFHKKTKHHGAVRTWSIRLSAPGPWCLNRPGDPPYVPNQFEYSACGIYIVAHEYWYNGHIKGVAKPGHPAYHGSPLKEIYFEDRYITSIKDSTDWSCRSKMVKYEANRASQDEAILRIGRSMTNFRKHRNRAVRLFRELLWLRQCQQRCVYEGQVCLAGVPIHCINKKACLDAKKEKDKFVF